DQVLDGRRQQGCTVSLPTAVVRSRGRDLLHYVDPGRDPRERRVVRGECRIGVHQEELAAVRTRACVRHGYRAGRIGRAAQIFIRKAVTRATSPCASGVTALQNKDAGRGEPVARRRVEIMLAGKKGERVDGAWRRRRVE